MKTKIVGLLLFAVSTAVFGQDFFYAVKYPYSYTIYRNEQKVGIVNALSDVQMLSILNATQNQQPVVIGNTLVTSQGSVPLPYSQTTVHVAGSGTSFIASANDTIWYMTNNSSGWQPIVHMDSVRSLDYQQVGNTSVVLLLHHDNSDGSMQCGYGALDGGISGGVTVQDSAISAAFLFGVQYSFTETSATLGTMNVTVSDFDDIANDQVFCSNSGCVFVPFEHQCPVQNFAYIKSPYLLGLDSMQNNEYLYHISNIELRAVQKLAGSISTSIDCPAAINWDVNFHRSNQHFSIHKKHDGVMLGDYEQRLFLRRIEFPGHGYQGFCCGYNLGKTWYENGLFWSVDDINAGPGQYNQLNAYDSLGQFKATYPASDPHDGMVCDSFTVLFGWMTDGIGTYQPPLIINNNTGQQYTVYPPNDFPPMVWDSCSVSNALPGQLVDADHANSIFMTWIEPLQCYLVLRSSRNLAKWPISWPMSVWRFYPNASKSLIVDTQLTQLVNSTSFGFDRDAGHDFQIESEGFGDNSWIISQFDDRSCEISSGGHANAHFARLMYDTIQGWSLSQIKIFPGLPTIAMSNTDLWAIENDTFVVVNSASGWSSNPISGIIRNSALGFFDFQTMKQVGAWDWNTVNSGSRPFAYQANTTHEAFTVPEFEIEITETFDTDSLVVTASVLPNQGTWYWWLGNKSVTHPLVIAKSAIPVTGAAMYISGQFGIADTIPNNTGSKSRFISNPKWITGTGVSSSTEPLQESVIVFPNPTENAVYISGISFDMFTRGIVTDAQGRTLFEIRENRVDMTSFPSGFYFITFVKGNSRITKKIIRL